MSSNQELEQLNENTFAAEAKNKIGTEEWDKFLWRVLADDFLIRRANPALLPQDKRQMITHINYDNNPVKRNVSEVKVFEDGNYGVVTSNITLEGQTARFHNLKVFTGQKSGETKVWQCVYWRVTRLPD